MIISWVLAALAWFLRLFIPRKPWQRELVINPNSPCPLCGHRKGAIVAVLGAKPRDAKVAHKCSVCQGEWQEDPVVKVLEDLLNKRQ